MEHKKSSSDRTIKGGTLSCEITILIVGEAGVGKTQMISVISKVCASGQGGVKFIKNPQTSSLSRDGVYNSQAAPAQIGLDGGTDEPTLTKVAVIIDTKQANGSVQSKIYTLNLVDTQGLLDLRNARGLTRIKNLLNDNAIGESVDLIFVLIQNGRLKVNTREAYRSMIEELSEAGRKRTHFFFTHSEALTKPAKAAILSSANKRLFTEMFTTYPDMKGQNNIHFVGCYDEAMIVDKLKKRNARWSQQLVETVINIVEANSSGGISADLVFKRNCILF